MGSFLLNQKTWQNNKRSKSNFIHNYFYVCVACYFLYMGVLFNKSSYKSSANFQKRLITKGPYKYIRHPIYLGTVLEQISIPLLAGLYYSAFGIFVLTVPFHIIKANIEEKNLVSDPNLNYKKYMEETSLFRHFYMMRKRSF